VPGIVLAIGYLRFFKGVTLPGSDDLLTSSWIIIMLAYAVRRLPYALRSCVAALRRCINRSKKQPKASAPPSCERSGGCCCP
jgi:ABC-type Fe3+ transport system permease subunit